MSNHQDLKKQDIERQLKGLLKDWEALLASEQYGDFIDDSPIDGALYWESQPRVVFLVDGVSEFLGEGNHEDLAQATRLLKQGRLLGVLAEWAYGLMHDFPAYEMVRNDMAKKRYALHLATIVGCYKFRSRKTIEEELLTDFIVRYKTQLRQQLDLLRPEILISTLGNLDVLRKLYPDEKLKVVSSGYNTLIGRLGTMRVIDFVDPRMQLPCEMTYCLLDKVVNAYSFYTL